MVINYKKINYATPELINNQFLYENTDKYLYYLKKIFYNIFDNKEISELLKGKSKIDQLDTLFNCISSADRFNENLLLGEYLVYDLCFSGYTINTISLEIMSYGYIGPMNYSLVEHRKLFPKTDAFCIKILYSLFYWNDYNDVFLEILNEMNIPYEVKHIIPINKKHKKRCIDFLQNHKSNNLLLNSLIGLSIDTYVVYPYYNSIIFSETYDEYNIGGCLEGFYSPEDYCDFDRKVDDIAKQYEEHLGGECFYSIQSKFTFDLNYMVNYNSFYSDVSYFIKIINNYKKMIAKWNELAEFISNKYQPKFNF